MLRGEQMPLWFGKRVRHYRRVRWIGSSWHWKDIDSKNEGIVLTWFVDGPRVGKMYVWFDNNNIELRWIDAFEETELDHLTPADANWNTRSNPY